MIWPFKNSIKTKRRGILIKNEDNSYYWIGNTISKFNILIEVEEIEEYENYTRIKVIEITGVDKKNFEGNESIIPSIIETNKITWLKKREPENGH